MMRMKQEGLSETPSSFVTTLANLSQHANDKTEQLNVTTCSKQ